MANFYLEIGILQGSIGVEMAIGVLKCSDQQSDPFGGDDISC